VLRANAKLLNLLQMPLSHVCLSMWRAYPGTAEFFCFICVVADADGMVHMINPG